MEDTLPQLKTEQQSEEELLQRQCPVAKSEERFRELLLRATMSLSFLTAGLIVYYLLPFYPSSMSVFFAIMLAVIAFRWPSAALAVLLVLAAPAYAYQLGGAMWALGVMLALAAVLPFCVSRLPGAIIGCVAGTAAGVLVLSPYFLLSLPLLVGATLFRLKGSSMAGLWAVLMFLAFHLPFLSVAQSTGTQAGVVPLLTSVDYAQRPSLEYLGLEPLKAAFGEAPAGFGDLSGFSAYFVEGWGGIALVLTLVLAVIGVPTLLNLSRRVRHRGMLTRGMMPVLTLLAVELVFLVPLQLLDRPLRYYTGFNQWDNIAVLTAIVLFMGGMGFAVEFWLSRRDLRVNLAGQVSALTDELEILLEDARQGLQQVAYVCRGRDLSDEKAAVSQSEEKVAMTVESLSALSVPRLEVTLSEFSSMRKQLRDTKVQLQLKLLGHLDDCRRSYKATVEGARLLGMPVARDAIGPDVFSPDGDDYESVLLEQEELNKAFSDLASELVAAGEMLAEIVKEEIDPEFSLTTIDIGRGFLEQGRYEEAARTILEDLQIIDGRIESPIAELATKVVVMASALRDVTSSHIIPMFEALGDTDSVERYRQVIADLDEIARSVQGSRTLADLIGIVEQSRRLADTAILTVTELRHKSRSLESANDRLCPVRYNWGKNSHMTGEVQQLLHTIESESAGLTISSRFSVIENAVQAAEQQARIIRKYSQASEFLINYPNVEYVIEEKLKGDGGVVRSDVPVNAKYAAEYLKLFAAKHYEYVVFDPRTATLKQKSGKKTG